MTERRPNIVWIMSEQTNANCLGCYGSPDCQTPNIDALAENGVRFDRAYSTSPICMPSRLTYLSGQCVRTHGFYGNTNHDGPEPSLALTRLLKEQAGYSSAAVGKMHIGLWDEQVFDRVAIAAGSRLNNDYQDYLKEQGLADKQTGWRKDDNVNFMLSRDGVPYEHSQPAWNARACAQMFDELKEPFFLWSSFSKPHPPFNLPADPPVTYDPAALSLPPGDIEAFKMKPFSTRLGVENIWDIETAGEEKFREGLAAYYTLISMMDDGIGRIVRSLEERNLLENTIIVYCADHGDFGGEHGQIGKNAVGGYEQLYRVPLIWYWAGHTGKEVIRALVDNTDFFPTVCDLLGLETPDSVQGESYARPVVLSGGTGGTPPFEGKESVLLEHCGMLKTVRTMTHKLSYRFDGRSEKGEMYDLTRDPLETVNLFDDPAHAHVRERLLRLIVNHLISAEQPRLWGPMIARPGWRWFERNFPAELPETPGRNRVRPRPPLE